MSSVDVTEMLVRATPGLSALALLPPPLVATAQLPPDAAPARSSQEGETGSRSDYSAALETALDPLIDPLEGTQTDYDTVKAVFEETSAGLGEERRTELDEKVARVELAVVSGSATAIAETGLEETARAATRAAVAEALSAYGTEADWLLAAQES